MLSTASQLELRRGRRVLDIYEECFLDRLFVRRVERKGERKGETGGTGWMQEMRVAS